MRSLMHFSVLCCMIFLLVTPALTWAQIDTAFWFAVPNPEVVDPNTESLEIALVVTTFGEGASVRIEAPASAAFEAISTTLAAQETKSIDLTPQRRFIINQHLNTPLNTGLLITATAPISAYYEIRHFVNPETFSLKGRNALGTHFFTPFQNRWRKDPANIQGFDVLTTSSIHVVATEDFTTIKFKATAPLAETFEVGQELEITLQRGQCYTISSEGFRVENNFAGTEIIADKPISVTVTDDSFYFLEHVGDQLLPTHLLGNRYIAIRGPELEKAPTDVPNYDKGPYDKVWVVATQNNTQINNQQNGESLLLDRGETGFFIVADDFALIEGNLPFYAYHISGNLVEPSASLLPPIHCNGSKEVGFFNSDELLVHLFLLTKRGNESGFLLNGDSSRIKASDFKPVGDTDWLWAEKVFLQNIIPVMEPQRLVNTKGLFHMGLMQLSGLSTTYSWLSDFTLTPNLSLGMDTLYLCEGETLPLYAGHGFESYQWSTGETTTAITVSTPGSYHLAIEKGGCLMHDTVTVLRNEDLAFSLGPEEGLFFCSEIDTVLRPKGNFSRYLWQDGSTGNSLRITAPGTYWVEVENNCGISTDTVEVIFDDTPLQFTTDTCLFDFTPNMQLAPPVSSYRWEGLDSNEPLQPTRSGFYTLSMRNGCETLEQETWVELLDLEELFFANAITPNGDGKNERLQLPQALEGLRLSITNRWGERIFYQEGYQNNWPAHDISAGVYYYQIEHPCMPEPLSGWVQVLK